MDDTPIIPTETVQVAARIPADLRDRAEKFATATDRTFSAVVRLALAAYLDEQEAA